MSPATIIGGIVCVFGLFMAGDSKSFGLKGPATGIAVIGAGGFLALFGLYGATNTGNREGSGRRVRDHSI